MNVGKCSDLEDFADRPSRGLTLRVPDPWSSQAKLLCDNLIYTGQSESELQRTGTSDVSKRVGNITSVSFLDEEKVLGKDSPNTVGLENMGTESLSGETGVVFKGVENIN